MLNEENFFKTEQIYPKNIENIVIIIKYLLITYYCTLILLHNILTIDILIYYIYYYIYNIILYIYIIKF